jgi:4-amino-4-deoxy-L-arabinose transferase-like glycosyltransferase
MTVGPAASLGTQPAQSPDLHRAASVAPSTVAPSTAGRRLLIAVLIAVAVLCVPYNLGLKDVVNVNEVQRLLPPIEMLERGDWVVPTIDDEPYLAKPPLIYWMVGASYKLFGSQATLVGRLPIALVCLLTALGVLVIGWRRANARVGLWSALLLLSSFFFRDRAQEAEIDPVLTSAVLGMVYWQWRSLTDERWLTSALVSGLFAGAALLLKGPVTIPFLAASTFAAAYVERPAWRRAAAVTSVILALGLAILLPWAVLLIQRVGWGTVWTTLNSESIKRIGTASRINYGPVYFYVGALAGGFLPWTWLLGFWASRRFRSHARSSTSSFFRVAGLFTLAAFVLFSLFKGKEAKYLLPLFPFMALLAGLVMDWLVRSDDALAWRGARIGFAFWALLGLCAPLMYISPLGPWLTTSTAAYLFILAGSGACLGALLLLMGQKREAAGALLVLGATILIVDAQDARKRRVNALQSPRLALAELTRLRREGMPVYRYRPGRPGLYYFRALTRKLRDDDPASGLATRSGDRFAVIMAGSQADSLLQGLDGSVEVLARAEAGQGRYVLLTLLPRPRSAR